MPGLVMLHEHLNYFSGRAVWHSQPVSYPKLYLAAGVTTIRTAGTEQPEVDLNLKRRIDKDPRQTPGPKIHLTGPFFNGEAGDFLGDTVVRDAEEARAAARYWAGRGFTSFKLYSAIGVPAARAIIEEAHRRGVRVTGHLGQLGCREAADLGIDSIEHSFVSCAKDLGADADRAGFKADVEDPKFQELVRHLVKRGIVMVATPMALDRPMSPEELDMLHPHARERYLRAAIAPPPWLPDATAGRELRKLERAFAAAGGRLGVGSDPADFGLIAGYANQRVVGLLVEAGWTPLEAIRLVTSNNAEQLGVGDSVGRVAEGWAADLIVVAGNPAADIKDLSKVEIVFRDGVGYDPAEATRGREGAGRLALGSSTSPVSRHDHHATRPRGALHVEFPRRDGPAARLRRPARRLRPFVRTGRRPRAGRDGGQLPGGLHDLLARPPRGGGPRPWAGPVGRRCTSDCGDPRGGCGA
jgi:hypothetical protein